MCGKPAEPAYNDKKFEYAVRCSRSKMGLTNPFNCSDLAHAEAYSVVYRFMLHVFPFCTETRRPGADVGCSMSQV